MAFQLPGGHRMPLLDAAYFTVETVTTVGYGDFSFRHQSPWLMAGAICLMLLGALFVAVFFAMLTNMLVSRRIEESLGRRRITGLRGHVLVIGLGSVGMQAATRLVAAGSEVVVVEMRDEQPAPGAGPGPRRAGGHRGRDPARDAGVGQPGQRVRGGRADQ